MQKFTREAKGEDLTPRLVGSRRYEKICASQSHLISEALYRLDKPRLMRATTAGELSGRSAATWLYNAGRPRPFPMPSGASHFDRSTSTNNSFSRRLSSQLSSTTVEDYI